MAPSEQQPKQKLRGKPASTERDDVRVIGAERMLFRDFHHAFLRAPWWAAIGAIVAVYLGLNVIFAIAFLASKGVSGARAGSFADAFYFSVQTMGTVGYGSLYPRSSLANAIMVVETVTGLIVTALATGLVFSKFSQPTALLVFAREVAIGPMEGVPTLMFRLGNRRGNQIVEAVIRVSVVRTERTKEGMVFYRMLDLKLSRERSPALSRSWTVMHQVTPESPLYGKSPDVLKAEEVELLVTVVGIDDTSLQPVHARHRYTDEAIVWGARPADVLSEDPDGALVLDLARFHDLVPTEPMPGFPYPAA